jgi:geranylgeranyl pyrophosphate synthase
MDQRKETDLTAAVQQLLRVCLRGPLPSRFTLPEAVTGGFGKMLRTALAKSVVGSDAARWPPGIVHACAATELVHSASLVHDDVIDGASVRRGMPSLWKSLSTNAAILVGDILLCEAQRILLEARNGRLTGAFMDKVREVCWAEAEQELFARGKRYEVDECVRIARSKTGALFAFIGHACGGDDLSLAAALEEAGYRIGTAYQLADDLADETATEEAAGKTLGTDRLRKKFTLAHGDLLSGGRLRERVAGLCGSACGLLAGWPGVLDGVEGFLSGIFYPACGFDRSAVLSRGDCSRINSW